VVTYRFPEQWVRILGKRIRNYISKNTAAISKGLRQGFQVPFLAGDNDWPAVMAALDEVGYTGWGIAEEPGGNSPEGLKTLSTAMGQIFSS
jgi:L-ribulose-5-phosphate 3-epimerase